MRWHRKLAHFFPTVYPREVTRFFIRLLNFTLLACFLGSLWGGWYLSKQGFGRKWRKKLSEEFAKRGVEMTTRRLTLDPLRGLVARDVRVYRSENQRETIATIDELRLDINYTRLLRNEPFLDALSLSNAEVLLDVDPRRRQSGEFAIHRLAAQLFFQQDRVEIRRLEGEGLGIFFTISGVLEHRPDWQSNPDPSNIWKPLQKIPREWLRALAETHFGQKPGRLELRFRGNLSQKRWLQSADGRLVMPELGWRGIRCKDLSMEADLTDRLVTLRHLNWRDDLGPTTLRGIWHPGMEGQLRVDSQGNAPAILQEMKLLAGPSSALKMDLKADLTWTQEKEFAWKVVGKLDAGQLIYRSVLWERVQMQFSLSPDRYFLQEISLEQKDGSLTGQFLSAFGQVKAEITSTLNPRSLWLSTGKIFPEWLEEFDFGANPWLQFSISSTNEAPKDWLTDGQIVFGRTNFRGVALTSAQANFSWFGPHLTINQVQITRPEGQLTGEAFWNDKASQLTLWNVKNSIDLVALGLWADQSLADVMETVRLPKSTILQGNGRLTWEKKGLAEIQLQITANDVSLFDFPILSNLSKSISANSDTYQFQTPVVFSNKIFRVGPFTAISEKSKWSGEAIWNLADQKFAGKMDSLNLNGQNSQWSAQSPWNQVVWSLGEAVP